MIMQITEEIVEKMMPARETSSRKGDNGSVLVVGGSFVYHGAPVLTSMAALRTGVDLVYTAIPKIHAIPVRAYSPNLIVIPLADGKLTRGATNKLIKSIPKKIDCAVIGNGMNTFDRRALLALLKALNQRGTRIVLDAGALVPEILDIIAGMKVILTPHSGEFYRVFGKEVPQDVTKKSMMVQECAKQYDAVIVLKSNTDIISDGTNTYQFEKIIPAMTVGGTGDVLAGIIGGLYAKTTNALDAGVCGAYFNGVVGSSVQDKIGNHLVATDLIDAIPSIMKKFDKTV